MPSSGSFQIAEVQRSVADESGVRGILLPATGLYQHCTRTSIR
jgi:hypothetical protein